MVFQRIGKEYIIRQNKGVAPEVPWSNVLANERFGSVVTSNLGRFYVF